MVPPFFFYTSWFTFVDVLIGRGDFDLLLRLVLSVDEDSLILACECDRVLLATGSVSMIGLIDLSLSLSLGLVLLTVLALETDGVLVFFCLSTGLIAVRSRHSRSSFSFTLSLVVLCRSLHTFSSLVSLGLFKVVLAS